MIKRFLRNIILREKASSQRFVDHLRKKGVEVGERVRFFSPSNTLIDLSCPWLISIGNDVNITHGVIILTHDYSWSVLKKNSSRPGEILGAQSPVRIGNNVYIGMNAIITRGVTIGDHVVIGAGSVVTRDCESGSVYAGVPARRIMSLEEFEEKRRSKQYEEAKKLALCYRERFGKEPPKEEFFEYFMLFSTVEEALAQPRFCAQMKTGGNFEQSIGFMKEHPPMFDSYEAFLKSCFGEEKPKC